LLQKAVYAGCRPQRTRWRGKDAKDAKDANIMTPVKDANGKQWWDGGVRRCRGCGGVGVLGLG